MDLVERLAPVLEVRGMDASDWPEVSRLISREWETDHPVLSRDFFFWQHSGFGNNAGLQSTPLAFLSGRLVGMRGVIPGTYQVPDKDGRYVHLPGGSFAMWIVEKASRGAGVGGALLRYSEEKLPVMVALGSNENTSVPIYLKHGFFRQDALHHWFAILDEKGEKLIYGAESLVPKWRDTREKHSQSVIPIFEPDVAAAVWNRFSLSRQVFSLFRSAEFWDWRYLRHPSFHYQIQVNESLTSLAVSRKEQVEVEGELITVLRLIEVFSSDWDYRDGLRSKNVEDFLRVILREAVLEGVSAVDFRCSWNLLGPFFEKVGFHYREMEHLEPGLGGFAGQLNPLIFGPKPINLHWKVASVEPLRLREHYFVKSDNDMDRPNRRGTRSIMLG